MQIYAQLYCLNSLLLAEVCIQKRWSRVVNTLSGEHSFLSGFHLFGRRDFPRQSFGIKCWCATLDLGFELLLVWLLEVNVWTVEDYVIHLWVLFYTLHLFACMFWHLKQISPVPASRGQSPDLSSSNASHNPHSHNFTVIIPTALVSSIIGMLFHSFINLCPVMRGGRAHKRPQLPGFTSLLSSFLFSRLSFLSSHLSFLTCHLSLSFVLFFSSLSLFNFTIVYCPVMWERQEAE